jgi:hypothetical protein
MKKNQNIIWLVVSVLMAVLCAAVRLWQRNTAFEGPHGLPVPMAPASVILLVLLAVSAIILAALALRQQVSRRVKKMPELALYIPGNSVFQFAMVCAAFLLLLAAPFLFLDGRQHWLEYEAIKSAAIASGSVPGGNNGVLMLAAAVTSVLSCLGLIMTTRAASHWTRKGRMGILMPVINNCLWLMELYRGHAAEPVRWNYAPMLVAVVFGMLLYLNFAGLFANATKPCSVLWLAGMTVVTSAVALAGKWDTASAVLMAAQILTAIAVLWCVPNNLKYPPELPAVELEAEEKLEEDTHE